MRCKVRIVSIEHTELGVRLKANPVSNGSEENKVFFKYTPSGQIDLSVINPDIVDTFKAGQELYVDFSPVTKPANT